jgi:hypothetical protein
MPIIGRLVVAIAGLSVFDAGALAAEEFVGPFPSWADVKRDYGAIGDGRVDDTAAIQRALDDLREHKKFCVLYFPAGTYRVTATVKTIRKAHTNCMVTVTGEDPATTILRWDGPQDGMIFQYDAWYAKISRLTLDGAGKAKIGLGYGDSFSTYNETSDMVFMDVATGMWMGTKSEGQAENAVLRCKFLRCSEAGVRTNGFNSMDIWVWYCHFEDCGYGLLNAAGNFHAYQNLFLRSRIMDIGIKNLMVFALVNNTSVGSKCFLDWSSAMTWGSPTSVSGNRIIEPTGDFAIRLGNGGPYLVMDNVIKSRPGSKKPAVHMTWSDQAFIGNTYTVKRPVAKSGRHRLLDEKVVDAETIDGTPPRLPGTPVKHRRKVFEVPAGAGAEAIQHAIDEAAKLKGQRPVIHLPMGLFRIERTLVVPAECDVQIAGDGASEVATVLRWVGRSGEPVLRLAGPARATVRDLHIQVGAGVGITVESCDQPRGSVFADQLNVSGGSPAAKAAAGVIVDGVDQADVLLRNFQGGTYMKSWIKVIGGTRRRVGKSASGQVSVFCGAAGTSDTPYTVEKSGRLVVRTVYHEINGDSPQALRLCDSGTLAVDSTRFSYKTAPDRPLIDVDGYRGDLALTTCLLLPVNSPHIATIRFRGKGTSCNALCMSCVFWAPKKQVKADAVWKNEANPPANAALLLCTMNGQATGAKDSAYAKGGFAEFEDRNTSDDDALIRKVLAPLREARVWLPAETKQGITDLRLHRVVVVAGKGGTGVELRATR